MEPRKLVPSPVTDRTTQLVGWGWVRPPATSLALPPKHIPAGRQAGAWPWAPVGGPGVGGQPPPHSGFPSSRGQPGPGPEGVHPRLGGVVPECEDGGRLRGREALPADRLEQAHRGECPPPWAAPARASSRCP